MSASVIIHLLGPLFTTCGTSPGGAVRIGARNYGGNKKHIVRRHQSRLVIGPLGGPTGPRRDDGPAAGLIELDNSF
jgi:hypothetical protein